MFNCFAIIWAGSPIAYFKTQAAADNFINMMNERTNVKHNMTVEGRYIENIAF